jgi:hypothetical protein
MAFLKKLTILAAITSLASGLPTGIRPTATVTLTPVATTTAIATSSSGSGINIVNNLNQTVYLWSTSDTSGDMQTLTAGGGTYTEQWRTNSDGGGISIKMATTTTESSVLQFEYTESDGTLWWDLSSINLDKDSEFISAGFAVATNDSSCSSASCAAGDTDCSNSYQQPDDVDTRSCSSSAAFTMTLG